jgi:hypothetical protein
VCRLHVPSMIPDAEARSVRFGALSTIRASPESGASRAPRHGRTAAAVEHLLWRYELYRLARARPGEIGVGGRGASKSRTPGFESARVPPGV